jgi:hypothetical protein
MQERMYKLKLLLQFLYSLLPLFDNLLNTVYLTSYEELHNLYSSPCIRMIKSRRMRWAGHVARMGEEEECIFDIGGKAGRKETTGKTKT